MRVALLKLAAAAALSLTLAACNTTGVLSPTETAHISRVQVSVAPNVSTERFAELVRARTTQQAARFGRAGAAKELRIVIQRHSYKNPAMSLLVGDGNFAGGRVAVVDVASGRVQGERDVGTVDSLVINGVVGAIIAAAQDKQKVDERLADGIARQALRSAYGSAAADPVLERPEPVAPGAAPGAAPTPQPAAKDVPVASATGRSGAKPGASAPARRSTI